MNDEIDIAILRMINQEYIARTGRPHLDLMELKSALDAAGLIPAQRLRDAEARAERLEAAATDVLSAFEPASVVHIGWSHYKYSAAWPTHIRNPVQRLRDALAPQDDTPQATCPLCDGSDLLCLDCAWLRAEAGEESGDDHE